MAGFHLDKNFKKNLEFFAQEKAKELAKEARERITNHYHSLIDRYYEDYEPKVDRHGVPYYIRTFGLYNSYREYYKNSHNSIYYGGIEVSGDKMRDYPGIRNQTITAQRLLYKYIYTPTQPSATWHGGDWHGGYGVMASFSLYNEIWNYRNNLIKEFQNRCSTR